MVSTRRTRISSDDIQDGAVKPIDLAASTIGTLHQRYFVQGGSKAQGTVTFPTPYSAKSYYVVCPTARMGSAFNLPYARTTWKGSMTMYGSVGATDAFRWISYGKR